MDSVNLNQIEWEKLTPEEKKMQLFLNQKKLLDTFLEKNAFLRHNTIRASEIFEIRWGCTG